MEFNAANFLQGIKNLVTGGGKTPPGTGPVASDGGYLHDVDYGKAIFAGTTLSSTAIKYGTICIPRDYDEAMDVLQLRLTGSTAWVGGTTMTMACQLVSTLIPGSTSVYASAVKSTQVTFPVASTIFDFTLDISGLGLKRGTVLTVSTVASGQAQSTAVAGGFLTYASDLVAFDTFGVERVGSTLQPIRG